MEDTGKHIFIDTFGLLFYGDAISINNICFYDIATNFIYLFNSANKQFLYIVKIVVISKSLRTNVRRLSLK